MSEGERRWIFAVSEAMRQQLDSLNSYFSAAVLAAGSISENKTIKVRAGIRKGKLSCKTFPRPPKNALRTGEEEEEEEEGRRRRRRRRRRKSFCTFDKALPEHLKRRKEEERRKSNASCLSQLLLFFLQFCPRQSGKCERKDP